MSFSRMKPLPKFLIIGGAVAALAYGASLFISHAPKSAVTEALKVETTAVPAEGTPVAAPVAEAAKAAPAPAPVAEAAPALTPATPSDAGLANVLGTGKK